jgi:hypothetical protein
MGGIGYLNSGKESCFGFDALQPGQANFAYAFKSTRTSSGFPNPRSKNSSSSTLQSMSSGHDLRFGFGAARSGNKQRLRYAQILCPISPSRNAIHSVKSAVKIIPFCDIQSIATVYLQQLYFYPLESEKNRWATF